MQLKPLNETYIKRTVTKFSKDTNPNIMYVYDESEDTVSLVYLKNIVTIVIFIKSSIVAKYNVTIECKQINLSISYITDSLNEVLQACELLIYPVATLNKPMELTAKIKASHWGLKLVTLEREDGYRANIYASTLLKLLEINNIIKLHNISIEYNAKTCKSRVKYDKSVLNYDKIQKEGNWNDYTIGWQAINQYPNGQDYIHPSLKWQHGRLF